MVDRSSLTMPSAAPTVSDQSGARQRYQQRKRREGLPPYEPSPGDEDYPPSAVERPDPNQPLYEALDRLRVVDKPVEPDPVPPRARAVKAYQEQTTATFRPVVDDQPVPAGVAPQG